jgi:hypothetical protein
VWVGGWVGGRRTSVSGRKNFETRWWSHGAATTTTTARLVACVHRERTRAVTRRVVSLAPSCCAASSNSTATPQGQSSLANSAQHTDRQPHTNTITKTTNQRSGDGGGFPHSAHSVRDSRLSLVADNDDNRNHRRKIDDDRYPQAPTTAEKRRRRQRRRRRRRTELLQATPVRTAVSLAPACLSHCSLQTRKWRNQSRTQSRTQSRSHARTHAPLKAKSQGVLRLVLGANLL